MLSGEWQKQSLKDSGCPPKGSDRQPAEARPLITKHSPLLLLFGFARDGCGAWVGLPGFLGRSYIGVRGTFR